jgi:hypothetical protein
MAVANAAAPPKITVKTGFSLSTIRAQTTDMGRITSGFSRNEPTKIIDRTNRNILVDTDNNKREKISIGIFCVRNAIISGMINVIPYINSNTAGTTILSAILIVENIDTPTPAAVSIMKNIIASLKCDVTGSQSARIR